MAEIDEAERMGSEFCKRVVRGLNGCEAPTASRARQLEHPRGKQVAEGENGNVVVEWTGRLSIAPDEPGDGNGIRRERLVGDVERFGTHLRCMFNNPRELRIPRPQGKQGYAIQV